MLSADDFAAFLVGVHGQEPFPWQQALVEELEATDTWPDVLDLPTGSGKTTALDAAVFHLALRYEAPGRAALRIALVVDRRLVVDEADRRARRIAEVLVNPDQSHARGRNVVMEVARRLSILAGADGPPLVVARLRGGVPLEHDWARTPTQPTILTSTVDQVGSRLLFRGYGISDRMNPVHAGLLGNDSLILLDEAHLSEPFRQTLDAVAALGGVRAGPAEGPQHDDRPHRTALRVALLTATPGARVGRSFALTEADRAHPVLAKRIGAAKPATLQARAKPEAFADTACAMMAEMRAAGISAPAVAVVVNRIGLARQIFDMLRQTEQAEAELMIGRSRDVDRQMIEDRLAPFRTGAEARDEAAPLFLVATQCLEVGVDLDLDGLVTQVASLDALRQRFGRLNRSGGRPTPRGAVLALAEDLAVKADDPVYGTSMRATWAALDQVAPDGMVEFGTAALDAALVAEGIDPDGLAAPRADAPVVMPAYLDLWSQTSPPPAADPEVGLFLHGTERSAPEVALVWRADVSEQDLGGENTTDLQALLSLMPPRSAETIAVPIWAARAWLAAGGRGGNGGDVPDVPSRAGEVAERESVRPIFRWAGAGDPRTGPVQAGDLRPGDLAIVPAEYGGCDAYGWAPMFTASVGDVADAAAGPYSSRRFAVRLTPALIGEAWPRVATILGGLENFGSDDVEHLIDALPAEAVEGAAEPPPANLRSLLSSLHRARGRIELHRPYGGSDRASGAVILARRGIEKDAGTTGAASSILDTAPITEDDTLASIASRGVRLDDHCNRVAAYVGRYAATLGLTEAQDLVLAARLHDAGKADLRFQTMLAGGDPWNRPDGPALAKSRAPAPPEAWERAGLPHGWRHEALSVRMAAAHPAFDTAHDPELVLWLIGTHHGLGRPFFGFAEIDEPMLVPCLGTEWQLCQGAGPQSLAYDLNGRDWPDLFEVLKQRYGIWGLAHVEAVLRLADHRASEEEQEQSTSGTDLRAAS